MRIEGKTAVITGGGSGIGAASAVALAGAGCRVIIAGRRESKLQEVANTFHGEPSIGYQTADVADRDQAKSLIENSIARLGHIDILVLAAGINVKDRAMSVLSPEDWDRHIAINLTGVYNCVHAALPHLRARKGGLIVAISSVAGLRGSELGGAAYSASKFGVDGFIRTVGAEELDNGIRTCVISPGEVDTEILRHRPQPVTDDHRERMLKGEDLAAAVTFVAGLPDRAYVPAIVMMPSYQKWT